MAEGKKGFMLYADLIHTVKKMNDEQSGKLFKQILGYVNDEYPESDDALVDIVFEGIKRQLKRDYVKYQEKLGKKSIGGVNSAFSKFVNMYQVDVDKIGIDKAIDKSLTHLESITDKKSEYSIKCNNFISSVTNNQSTVLNTLKDTSTVLNTLKDTSTQSSGNDNDTETDNDTDTDIDTDKDNIDLNSTSTPVGKSKSMDRGTIKSYESILNDIMQSDDLFLNHSAWSELEDIAKENNTEKPLEVIFNYLNYDSDIRSNYLKQIKNTEIIIETL